MKNLTILILLLTFTLITGCNIDSIDSQSLPPQPLKTDVNILWNGTQDSKLILIDYNNTLPDTILNTVSNDINLKLLDRGYYEINISNPTSCITQLYVSNTELIVNYSSNTTISGLKYQFFNR
jgi:hypothetical protein